MGGSKRLIVDTRQAGAGFGRKEVGDGSAVKMTHSSWTGGLGVMSWELHVWDNRVDSGGACFMFYPGADAAVQTPVVCVVPRHVVSFTQWLNTPRVTCENLHRRGRHKKKKQRIMALRILFGLKGKFISVWFFFYMVSILLWNTFSEMKDGRKKKNSTCLAKIKSLKIQPFKFKQQTQADTQQSF